MEQLNMFKIMGKVKFFNDAKGYGFIIADGQPDTDIFCHYSQIMGDGFKTLSEGQSVVFDLVTANSNLYGKGKDYQCANNIEKV